MAYRVGKSTRRSVLNPDGTLLVMFEEGQEQYAQEFVNYLNNNIMQNEQVKEGMKVKTKDGKFWFVGQNHFADIWYLRPIDDTKQQVLHSAAFFEATDYGNSVLPKNDFRTNIWLRSTTMQVPQHYDNSKGYDVIDFCNDYKLNFNRGSAIKYIARSGKKDDEIEDLKKAIDFLQREIQYLQTKNAPE